ncbi:MAG: START domain-containing protein [Bacteroidota bacterium]
MKPLNYFLSLITLFIVTAFADAQDMWQLKLDKEGIKVYTKKCDGTPVKSVKAECVMTTSVSDLTAILLDINKSKEWIYATKSVSVLKEISPSEIIYYSEVELPWPVSNRDFIVDLSVTQDSATKIVTVTSINKSNLIAPSKDVVRVEHSWSQWKISPLPGGRLNVEYELQVDPGGKIPAWLTNMFATTGPFYTFQKLKEQLKKAGHQDASLAFIKN